MNTKLFMLTETSAFMMSFVIVTKNNNCIVVDGGRPEDMPLLKEYVGSRKIKAWILTHAHSDHISGIISEIKKNRLADFNVEAVLYNFPSYEKLLAVPTVEDRTYYLSDINESLPEFSEIEPEIADIARTVKQGEIINVDEVSIEILYTVHEGLTANPINDSSLVFKLTAPEKSVLFLGDLGPDGGDILYRESRYKLKSDLVQMAHHGHMNVSMEIYEAIAPEACLWCAPMWLYEEPDIPDYLADAEKMRRMGRIRMYGTGTTRKWMDALGVKKHYVTGMGTREIDI